MRISEGIMRIRNELAVAFILHRTSSSVLVPTRAIEARSGHVIQATKTSLTPFLSFADSLDDATEDRDIERAAIDDGNADDGNAGDGG